MHQSNTQPSNNHLDPEAFDFLDTLVQAILGINIKDIPIDKQAQVIKECVKLYTDYINDYVTANFGIKSALRIKASQKFNDLEIINKHPELENIFKQATLSFLENLK